ncbi:hypothetical protein DT076_13905 [Desertihabitans brevis]|uniref:Uncharacterized protein n=1 Tax=Desertihabitans brevis TaxID=2268447 RepID=A0A367YSX7_9ACTN|nr:hypothetical protein DT076_13905 [Desertihabitans brevis]
MLGGVLLSVALLTGCSAAPAPTPPPQPPASTVVVAGAVTLRELGLTHGPVDLVTLPEDVTVLERIDQPNVITLVLTAEDGPPSAAHLEQTLPDVGYTVDATGGGSLLFSGPGWSGAFTTSTEVSGLTLRQEP